MTSPTLPRYVALSGNPTSGKTTVAEILRDKYGYTIADDGQFLREIGKAHFGLTHDQVYTQAGKLETVTINGAEMTVRDVLGRIGNGFEHEFGADVIPEISFRGIDPTKRYVFQSVRREQGFFYRKRGALCLEINNPLAGPSPYEFDRYNAASCHLTIGNHFLANGLDPVTARARLAETLSVAVENAYSIVRDLAV